MRRRGRLSTRSDLSFQRLRRTSLIAVAVTGLLLLLLTGGDDGAAQEAQAPAETASILPDSLAVVPRLPAESVAAAAGVDLTGADTLSVDAAEEATGTLRDLWSDFRENLPKVLIAIGVLLSAWVLVRLLRAVLRLVLRRWEKADASAAVAGIVIWLVAAGIALSVLVGDIRALAGSLGLVGLALSWALQTPIESFTGWLLNSFRGYYRVGDRIAVGDLYGDVYRIDLLNTTIWEYGGVDHPPGWVDAEQPTGRLITFPNNEVLAGAVINYTRDFPYVWDELTIAVGVESDLVYAIDVLAGVGRRLMGDRMVEPARRYREILDRQNLGIAVSPEPEVYASTTEGGIGLTIRYLVGAREKRTWKSRLVVAVSQELQREEHRGRIAVASARDPGRSAQADLQTGSRSDPAPASDQGDELSPPSR